MNIGIHLALSLWYHLRINKADPNWLQESAFSVDMTDYTVQRQKYPKKQPNFLDLFFKLILPSAVFVQMAFRLATNVIFGGFLVRFSNKELKHACFYGYFFLYIPNLIVEFGYLKFFFPR